MGDEPRSILSETEVAIFAGGCFWCLEAVFDQVRGVDSVESGYIGGHLDHPTYEAVCGGQTGHAEAVRISFDGRKITYQELLEIFFTIHDPTTLNRQGNPISFGDFLLRPITTPRSRVLDQHPH